jgi:hypothetical protein
MADVGEYLEIYRQPARVVEHRYTVCQRRCVGQICMRPDWEVPT